MKYCVLNKNEFKNSLWREFYDFAMLHDSKHATSFRSSDIRQSSESGFVETIIGRRSEHLTVIITYFLVAHKKTILQRKF